MKTIFRIARTELQVMFYSPIAWMILVIFAFQAGLIYTGIFDNMVRRISLGWNLAAITSSTYGGTRGLFTIVQSYLYLYIPLLTMGIMSRELSSGSIKLLYSSPVTNYQIILGKYLAIIVYALAITGVLGIYATHSFFVVENVEYRLVLTGLLGLFLVVCAYGAIGLFMSSITSYTVVAAMGTLAVLAFLNMVRGMWQEIEIVREITYWFAISGRADTFIRGMITSEDVLYFFIVVSMFVSFSIIRLQNGRRKTSFFAAFSRYVGVVLVVVVLGWASMLPRFKGYLDVTYSKVNTLTESSQKVVSKLHEPLTVHTYVNLLDELFYLGLPNQYMQNIRLFENYTRFKPDLKFKTYYYYHDAGWESLNERFPNLSDEQRIDTLIKLNNWKFKILPYSEIQERFQVDLADENFRFVRMLEKDNGERTFLRVFNDPLRHPSEAEISAAFKRLVMDHLPTIGFVTGHNERSSSSLQDRGYRMIAQEKTFRQAMINQGFDFIDVSLDQEIPEIVQILVIAEPRDYFSDRQLENLNKYIAKGGNMILASEPESTEFLEPIVSQIGVSILPGMLVKPTEQLQPDLLLLSPTRAAMQFSFHLQRMALGRSVLTMPGASGLTFDRSKGFEVTTLFTTDSTGSWNELQTTNFIDDSVTIDFDTEREEAHATVLALSREVDGKTQKILVTGDADWLSNSELGMSRNDVRAANYSLISAAFFWLSDEEVPVDMRRAPPIDRKISTTPQSWKFTGFSLKWGLPILLMLAGVFIWIRRRGR